MSSRASTVNQSSFGYNRIFNYITSQGTGTCASATIVPGGIPNANLGCPGGSTPTCAPGAYSCGLVSTIVAGGYWAIGDRGYSPFQGGTNIFSYKDSLDLIRGKHNFKFGIDFRANQMNVGTEAFQDGFWIIGNGGNFTGLSSAIHRMAIRRQITCSASPAWPFMTRRSMVPWPAAAGRSIAPLSRMIGESLHPSPSISAWRGT